MSENQSLETLIFNATTQLDIATEIRQYDSVFKQLEELFELAPQNGQIHDLARRLVVKNKTYLPRVNQLFTRHGIVTGNEEALETLRNQMRDAVDHQRYDETERIYQTYKTGGGYDATIEERYQRVQRQREEQSDTGRTVSFDILQKLNQALSTYRVGNYQSCADLCGQAMETLVSTGFPLEHPTTQQLNQLRDDAQFKLDRNTRLAEGLHYLEDGKWHEALQVFEASYDEFNQDEVFNNYLENTKRLLEQEADIDREIRNLRTMPENIGAILNLGRDLRNLPSDFGVEAAPTQRQQRTQQILEDTKFRLLTSLLRTAKDELELSHSALNEEQKMDRLTKSQKAVDFVLELDPDNNDGQSLKKQITQEKDARQKAQKNRKRRNKAALYLLITTVVVILISFVVLIGQNIIENNQITNQNNMLTAVAADTTGTAVAMQMTTTTDARLFTEAAITMAAQATADAIHLSNNELTAQAERTAMAATATREALDLQLTLDYQTAIAQEMQTQAAQSNQATQQYMTLAAEERETGLEQQRIYATQTVEYYQLQTAMVPTPTPFYVCQGVITLTQGVIVREQPSVNSTRMGTIANGRIVEIYDFSSTRPGEAVSGWYRILYTPTEAEGTITLGGWVAIDYVTGFGCPDNFGG